MALAVLVLDRKAQQAKAVLKVECLHKAVAKCPLKAVLKLRLKPLHKAVVKPHLKLLLKAAENSNSKNTLSVTILDKICYRKIPTDKKESHSIEWLFYAALFSVDST